MSPGIVTFHTHDENAGIKHEINNNTDCDMIANCHSNVFELIYTEY